MCSWVWQWLNSIIVSIMKGPDQRHRWSSVRGRVISSFFYKVFFFGGGVSSKKTSNVFGYFLLIWVTFMALYCYLGWKFLASLFGKWLTHFLLQHFAQKFVLRLLTIKWRFWVTNPKILLTDFGFRHLVWWLVHKCFGSLLLLVKLQKW